MTGALKMLMKVFSLHATPSTALQLPLVGQETQAHNPQGGSNILRRYVREMNFTWSGYTLTNSIKASIANGGREY